MIQDRSTSKLSTDKKPLQQSSRTNSASSTSRRKPGSSMLKATSKQPSSQSQKSIMNSIEARTKTNGSECSSARKNTRTTKESGFKTIKNKVIGDNKENAKKERTPLETKVETSNTNTLQPKTANTQSTPRNHHIIGSFYPKQETTSVKSRSVDKGNAVYLKAPEISQPKPITIDSFEIGKKLGKGRFGDVFLVREKRLGMVMAMKMINKQELKESDMMGQLIFEIKIQSFINHPNTLRMFGYFHDEKYIYMLLELASSGCLFRQLKAKVVVSVTQSCLKEHQAAYYLRQVIAGLKHLHCQSIIHRDIKPENILNSFGVLKLCDFGWAVYSPLYQRQTFCGTLDYVPPEIVEGEFYDEKVDIWCIGILCYEMCTGHAPFEAKNNELETYDKILSLDLQFPVTMSSEVVDFISRLLIKDPQARMSFAEMEEHPFMKKHENEAGRLISREIWEGWQNLRGN